jgi:hypothetical protein
MRGRIDDGSLLRRRVVFAQPYPTSKNSGVTAHSQNRTCLLSTMDELHTLKNDSHKTETGLIVYQVKPKKNFRNSESYEKML